jgi:hypothetical protein
MQRISTFKATLSVVAAVAALAAGFARLPAARAQATTITTNETIAFSDSRINPCNGDIVAFSGNIHLVNHVTTDAAGGTHVETHVNYSNVEGLGSPSGATYRVVTTRNTSYNDSATPQSEMTVIQVINLIGQGSVPNFRLFMTFHITVNANGQTTSTVSNVSTQCSGPGGN